MKAYFLSRKHEVGTIWTYYFRTEKKYAYEAGQFTELILPDLVDPKGNRRWFTLSSAPSEELLAVTTRHQQDDSPYKRSLCQLQPGSQVEMTDAMGDFVLPLDTQRQLVFIAVGLGITPFRSMLQWLYDTGQHRAITMLSAAKSEAEQPFMTVSDAYHVQSYESVSLMSFAPENRISGLMEKIPVRTTGLSDPIYYIAGPPSFVSGLATGLRQLQIPAYDIVTDAFSGYDIED